LHPEFLLPIFETLDLTMEVERPPFFGVFPVFVPSLSWLNVRLYIYINGAKRPPSPLSLTVSFFISIIVDF